MESAVHSTEGIHNPNILPCPFCGEQRRLQVSDKDHSGEDYIFCPTCRCEGPPGDTKYCAFEGWGKRAAYQASLRPPGGLSPEEFTELMFSESSALKRSQGYHSTKERCVNCRVYGGECGNRAASLDHDSWSDIPADRRTLTVEFAEVLLRALEKRLTEKRG